MQYSIAEFRRRFPILQRKTYVNSCSQGALCVDVRAALDRFVDTWDEQGSPWELWGEESERLRRAIAAAIGADADEIALMPSASAGINAIASSLSFDRPRREVAMGPFEFPTMAQIWLAQERVGAGIVWARAVGEELPLAAYEAVVSERTLIVPATHVCFRNGYRIDVGGLARLCRERGAYLMLDDYQRTGTGPIDVHALGVDFMVGGCLKYLLSPSGIGFLYVRRELIERLIPRVTGWKGRTNPFAYRSDLLDWPATARRFETGALSVPSTYGAATALELLEAVGFAAIERQVATLVSSFLQQADDESFVVLTARDPNRRGPLVVVRSTDAPELMRRLNARDVVTSARGNGLRVSFHGYNNEEDVERVMDALGAEASLLERQRRTGPALTLRAPRGPAASPEA